MLILKDKKNIERWVNTLVKSLYDKNDPIFNRIPLELSMTWLSRACWWLNSIFNQCGWKLQAVWCPLGEHRETVRTAGRNWTVSFKNYAKLDGLCKNKSHPQKNFKFSSINSDTKELLLLQNIKNSCVSHKLL